jgi:iron complex outermembrane receptor protein
VGKFTTRLNWTYVDSWKQDGVEYAGTNGGSIATLPRNRYALTGDWDHMGWGVTARFNYIDGYQQQLLAGSFFAPTFGQNSTYPENVPHYRTWDLFARYQFNKNLTLNASVINVEDAKPPYDPGFSATYLYDFSLYSVLGRQVRVGFTYRM